jgi:hypothetical protein
MGSVLVVLVEAHRMELEDDDEKKDSLKILVYCKHSGFLRV